MKKAMLQAAGTAVLGIALAAAAVAPASADGLGGVAGGFQGPSVDGVSPAALTGAPGTGGSQLLGSQSGVHTVTGTAQDLVNSAAPTVQNATQAVGRLSQAPNVTGQRALPTDGLPVALPAVGGLPAVNSLPGVSQATQALPMHTPLGGLTG